MADEQSDESLPISTWFPPLPQEAANALGDVPSSQEIHDALMTMAPLKLPGWDGLHVEFFQRQWVMAVGNGRSIDIFRDVWIPSLGPLYRYLLDPAFAFKGLTFSNLITVDGNWDISSLSALFAASTIAHILIVQCPSLEDGDEKSMRLKRHFMYCTIAMLLKIFGYKSSLWLSPALSSRVTCNNGSPIWKRRNDLIFHNPILTTDAGIISPSLAWANYYSDCVVMGKVSISHLWSEMLERDAPGLEWVYLNIDGAVSMLLSDGSIGGLFRDSNGDWIMGFVKEIGHSNSLHAELCALFEGFSLAWKQGFGNVLVLVNRLWT
ncbi:hypothetical protein V6N12_012941 [Hibiscus sabdariffa]|uniref:RNase H type-1 domain-containing protein n=1 Tax=Hibiscus sabdariffa TaxID=183260 RepID=A0ABR2EFV2_9ROSI